MKKTNKKNIFGIFSIVDIIIILVLLGVLLVCYVIMGGNKNNQPNRTITFRVKVSEVKKDIVDRVKIGDILYDVGNNNKVGQIVNIDVEKSYFYIYNYEDKYYRRSETEDKYNLYLEIQSEVYETESNLLIGNLDIKSGTFTSLKTKDYVLYVYILNISR